LDAAERVVEDGFAVHVDQQSPAEWVNLWRRIRR